ncbi:MAG: hypothetical protein LBT31_07185 [Synergistaceae bacterium]|jgi:hypothetical protein|nr:hypothetical protein [Synergistaceae bacterium]
MDANQRDVVFESRFTVGGVLSKTGSTIFQKPAVFLGLSAISLLTAAAFGFMVPEPPASGTSPEASVLVANALFGIAALVIYLICYIVIQGATAHAVYRGLTDGKPSVMEAVVRGLARFFPLILLSLIYVTCFSLALILFLIPGIMLMCRWAISAQACVVERLGPLKSLGRSAYLTKGHRWKILALLSISYLSVYVINILIAFVLDRLNFGAISTRLILIIALLVPNAFCSVLPCVVYYDLRSVKEGLTIDNLSNVFD